MKLQIMSDLHVDDRGRRSPPPLVDGVDVVVVAGDTREGLVESLELLRGAYPPPAALVVVAGNHEFYSRVYRNELAAGRERAVQLGIHLLENNSVQIGEAFFVGATLWTDYELFGSGLRQPAMRAAYDTMRDHKKIKWNRDPWQRFRPQEASTLHQRSKQFIESELARPRAGITVLVTHHPTTIEAIDPRDERSLLAAAYASNVSTTWSIDAAPDIAISGHTHRSIDFRRGKTRFISNPRGYVNEAIGFNPSFVLELPEN